MDIDLFNSQKNYLNQRLTTNKSTVTSKEAGLDNAKKELLQSQKDLNEAKE